METDDDTHHALQLKQKKILIFDQTIQCCLNNFLSVNIEDYKQYKGLQTIQRITNNIKDYKQYKILQTIC